MPKKSKIRIKSNFEQKNALWGEFGENEGRTGENRGEKSVNLKRYLPIPEYKTKVVIRMTENFKYYEEIRKQYPETITKEQFYKIAHISKATALHLLQNNLVPCKDTGKRTRRYTIRTDDVIYYMIDRQLRPEKYLAPDKWYSERSGHRASPTTYKHELTNLTDSEKEAFRSYIEHELDDYDDLLKVCEVVEFLGYTDTSIHGWVNAKKLKAFHISNKFLIPKICLVDFLSSPASFGITRKTWKHLLLIKNFLKDLNQ